MKAIINCVVKTSIKVFVSACFLFFSTLAQADNHAIAMFGKPRYAESFPHFDYANPKALKGGALRMSQLGSFDSLNPLLPIGLAAFGVRQFVYESLMTRSLDEPFTLYGLLARKIKVSADRKKITFWLHPQAAFSDGSAVGRR